MSFWPAVIYWKRWIVAASGRRRCSEAFAAAAAKGAFPVEGVPL